MLWSYAQKMTSWLLLWPHNNVQSRITQVTAPRAQWWITCLKPRSNRRTTCLTNTQKLFPAVKSCNGFSCLQMTRHSSVRCVSDSSLQTATCQNTRKSTGIRSLHVRSAIRCSTGKMSCWTIKGGTWKVNLLQINLIISLGAAVELGRLRKW